jgi:hypothetical protein
MSARGDQATVDLFVRQLLDCEQHIAAQNTKKATIYDKARASGVSREMIRLRLREIEREGSAA